MLNKGTNDVMFYLKQYYPFSNQISSSFFLRTVRIYIFNSRIPFQESDSIVNVEVETSEPLLWENGSMTLQDTL